MGREIRKVPKGWEHPKNDRGEYQPMYDEDYETALNKWWTNHCLWIEEKHPDQIKSPELVNEYKYFAEWDGNAPDVEYYRPKWTDEERKCIQMYETVSEGTPVSPVFETEDELIEYLVEYGDFWAQSRGTGGYSREAAEKFVRVGWAPSLIITGGQIYSGVEVVTLANDNDDQFKGTPRCLT
jgi:hypothetical protein